MDLLIVGFGAFGLLCIVRQALDAGGIEAEDSVWVLALVFGAAACTSMLYTGDVGYWFALGMAGLGVARLLLELFRLLQVVIDVQRMRVLLASQQSSSVRRPTT